MPTWHETLDGAGNVRQVRPQVTGTKAHYLFDGGDNKYGYVKMNITLEDIRQEFDSLSDGTESREEIADFAARAMEADDAGSIEMDLAFSDKIWKAILYFSGVDLKVDHNRYLQTTSDFASARKEFGV